LSDIPFSVMFMLTLWLFPEEELDAMSPRGALALGGMIAGCYLIRTAGLFVLLGYAMCIAVRAQRHPARTIGIVTSVVAIVAGVLWLRAKAAGAPYSYLQLLFLRDAWVADSGWPSLADWYARSVKNGTATLRAIYRAFANHG